MATQYSNPLPKQGIKVKRENGKLRVYRVKVEAVGEIETHAVAGRKVYTVYGKVFSSAEEAAKYLDACDWNLRHGSD